MLVKLIIKRDVHYYSLKADYLLSRILRGKRYTFAENHPYKNSYCGVIYQYFDSHHYFIIKIPDSLLHSLHK